MEESMKKRGAWIIHVKATDVGRGTDVEYSPALSDGTPHCGEQKNVTKEKEG